MVFTVRDGLLISSIMYRIRKEGRAIRIKMMAGRMVQIVSTSCALHLGILVVWDMPYEVYRTFTCNLTLTKLYNVLLTPRLLRET